MNYLHVSVPRSFGDDAEHIFNGANFLFSALHPDPFVLVFSDEDLVLSRVQQVNDVLVVYLQVLALNIELCIGELSSSIVGQCTGYVAFV
jgi:hypothetical protein